MIKINKLFKRVKSKIERMKTNNNSFFYSVMGQKIYAPPKHITYQYVESFKNLDVKLAIFAKYISNKYPNTAIIDIGANIGDSLAIIKSSSPQTKVICVEGNEYFYTYLLKNAANYNNVICLNHFVAHKSGAITVNENKYSGSTSYTETSGNGKTKQSVTLTEIIADNNIPECGLIKSDTDGFDFKILLSAIEVIELYKPVLFFEYDINWNHDDPADSLTLMNSLSNLGYVFIVYDNFGNYMKCIDINTNVNNFFSDLNIYILQSRKFGGGYFYSDILAIHKRDHDLLDLVLDYEFKQVAKDSKLLI